MKDSEIHDKLDAYDEIIQSEKRVSIRSFRVVCMLYILEFILCALGIVSVQITLNVVELTSIISLCFTIYLDNQIHKSVLLYKNEVINLSLRGENVYCEYFSKQKSITDDNCVNRESFVWIHFFILVLSFTLNFAISLNFHIESPKTENRDVIINNTVILPNDSTIIIR